MRKPLRHNGKASSYPPLGKSGESSLDIWATTQKGKESEGVLTILKAIQDDKGFHVSGENLRGKVLLYPGGMEDSLLIWQGDTVLFSVDQHLRNSYPAPIMLCHYGASSREMKYLGGLLHLKYDSEQLQGAQRIVIETDSAHMISGIFNLTLSAQEPEMTAVAGNPQMYVDVSLTSKEVYFPIPDGEYNTLTVYCEDENGIVLAEYSLGGFKIQKGGITTVTIPQEHKGKGKVIQRASLDKLYLMQRGATVNFHTHEYETKDTTSLSGKMSFSRATGLFRSHVQVFHHNTWYVPLSWDLYSRRYNREKRNLIDDSYWAYPPILELNPGENIFYPSAIVFRKDGHSETSQFVRGPRETVWLYIRTYTCDFNYKYFTRNDTLCGYVPEWKTAKSSRKMGIRRGAESYIDWEFTPDNNPDGKVTNRIKEPVCAHHEDNHLRHSLKLQGVKKQTFWDAATDKIEEYQVVKHGAARYQAVTVYRKNGTGRVKYRDATGEPKKFTTDIIYTKQNASRQSDGSVEYTGGFKTSYVLSFGDSIKFDPSFFDGCERGFIVVSEEEYKQSKGKPVNIRKNKHVSKSKRGDEFKCVIPGNQKVYYIWAYLQIGKYLFLGDKYRYPAEDGNSDGNSIFHEFPALADPYTSYVAPFADDYVSKYHKCDEKNIGTLVWDMQKAEKLLGEKYNEVTKTLEKSLPDTSGDGLDYELSYSTEDNLPYKIVEPIKYGIGIGDGQIFEEIELIKRPQVTMRLLGIIGAEPVSIIKQYPLMYIAAGKMKIQILDIEGLRKSSLSGAGNFLGKLSDALMGRIGIVNIHGYVPCSNGPDGKKLGRVKGFAVLGKDSKPGDIVDVTLMIVGWGPREIVDQMQRVIFTREDPDKDKFEKEIKFGSAFKFPVNPVIDWMDDWYEAIKVKYHQKFKPSTKTP